MAGLPQRVGSYEIVDRIGAGGMGEVYRARDTRLGRDVAIKILSRDLASDSQLVARLEREAQLLAALNHPGIATIHGIEVFEGTPALVLELVEGPTLSERLARQRLPESEALSIALQIAEALEIAHERGIVHRDLKPANIKFTTQGRVKVLDFGVAKMVPQAREDEGRSAVQTMMATEAGAALIIGTPAYMSPEQARGEAAERTSDTWAFGCVVFEMLAGTRPFEGGTTSDVISAVLRAEPDWQALPPDTSLPLTLLLRRCLQKDPRRRLQHIGDARIEIEQLLTDPVATVVRREPPRRANRAAMIAIAALSVLVALTSAVIVRSFYATAPPARPVQFQIPIQNAGATIKISPDGRHIAYADPVAGARENAIWIRPLDSLTARMLPGTEGVGAFTWSWNSRFIAFTARPDEAFKTPRLKKIDVTTGSTQVLADDPSLQQAPAWGRDDAIVYASPVQRKGTIRKVSASGGEPVDVTARDLTLGERSHMWPSFLPDGRHFLYLAWSAGTGEKQESGRVYVGSINPAEPRRLVMEGPSMAIYAQPGYLLFANGEALMARPFDASTFQFTGDSVTVSDAVQLTNTGRIGADVSDDGTLIYRRQEPRPSLFAWQDRSGTIVAATECPVSTGGPAGSWRLAPNGNSVAVFSSGDPDIWLCDLNRNQTVRLSNDPFADHWPVWSPDSARVAFQSFRTPANRESALYEKAANGATPERLLVAAETGIQVVPNDWSLDGNWIVFTRTTPVSRTATSPNRDLWLLPMTGSPQPRAYLQTPFDEVQAALSPDARYVAYVSNEVGLRYEVVVQPFPDPSRGKWTVSTNGGCCPQWKRDGTELYYTNGDRQVVAVPVKTTPAFEMGQPAVTGIVVAGSLAAGAPGHTRNVAADGQRFLVNNAASPAAEDKTMGSAITVLVNWVAGSKLQR